MSLGAHRGCEGFVAVLDLLKRLHLRPRSIRLSQHRLDVSSLRSYLIPKSCRLGLRRVQLLNRGGQLRVEARLARGCGACSELACRFLPADFFPQQLSRM